MSGFGVNKLSGIQNNMKAFIGTKIQQKNFNSPDVTEIPEMLCL